MEDDSAQEVSDVSAIVLNAGALIAVESNDSNAPLRTARGRPWRMLSQNDPPDKSEAK